MNSEDVNQEQGRTEILKENLNLGTTILDISEKQNDISKEKEKRRMRMLKTKIKSKLALGHEDACDRCFSGSNFTSQYEDECPVNYSLKYSETESCKAVDKCESNNKKEFKDFVDFSETDLDQPTNFSLKYAEKTCDEESKSSAFDFYNNPKTKFREYTDYVETDLDQPTDFTLKYRESAEEELNFYENEEQKPSEDSASSERLPEAYTSQNDTPLMFSRSSSMNSLSSFVHITQSIPDDRSSVLSDFSRMTSGIISPSELPDSPTQTAPSSPKRHKPSLSFSTKSDFLAKQSVFEDDVATYKQEGTPIEFSRATSLSSLNIDNPVKSELLVKRNPTNSLHFPKEENENSADHVDSEKLKHQTVPEKSEPEKGKFELASVLEVDENLFADCFSIDIQINCRKPEPNYGRLGLQESSNHIHQISGLPVKSNLRMRFHNENKKSYSTYEGSDDAVHTYHTEGTPANVSHAGSHSDLSTLSMSSGIPLLGVDDNSDREFFFSGDVQTVPVIKAEHLKNNMKIYNGNQSLAMSMGHGAKRDVYINDQSPLDYLRKDHHQFIVKDDTATFDTEISPCDVSVRSSLSDLTVNEVDGAFSINRVETCEEPPPQLVSPLRNVSPQSPNSLVFEEMEDAGKHEEERPFLPSKPAEHEIVSWDHSNGVEGKPENKMLRTKVHFSNAESVHIDSLDFDSILPLTPFEEALVEECIRLGMPQKKNQIPLQGMCIEMDNYDKPIKSRGLGLGKGTSTKSSFDGYKNLNGKKISLNFRTSEKFKSNTSNIDNFDFDSCEPLTPFEEVLLEQCIRLGMPQKKNYKILDEPLATYLDEGTESTDCNSSEMITPLETALLNQCIRLGMPQKKTQKKEGISSSDEPHKGITCLTAHFNKMKLNSENEKDREALKKHENCSCGKKHNNRRKSGNCKKFKNRFDSIKTEN